MKIELMQDLLKLLDGSVSLVGDNLEIKDRPIKKSIHQLVKISSLDTGVSRPGRVILFEN